MKLMHKHTLKIEEIIDKLRKLLFKEINEFNDVDEEDKTKIAIGAVCCLQSALISHSLSKDEGAKDFIKGLYETLQKETFAHYEKLLKKAGNE